MKHNARPRRSFSASQQCPLRGAQEGLGRNGISRGVLHPEVGGDAAEGRHTLELFAEILSLLEMFLDLKGDEMTQRVILLLLRRLLAPPMFLPRPRVGLGIGCPFLPVPRARPCPRLRSPPDYLADSARDACSGPTTSCPHFPPRAIAHAARAIRSRRSSKIQWKNSSPCGTSASTRHLARCTGESVHCARDSCVVGTYISASCDSAVRILTAPRRMKSSSPSLANLEAFAPRAHSAEPS